MTIKRDGKSTIDPTARIKSKGRRGARERAGETRRAKALHLRIRKRRVGL